MIQKFSNLIPIDKNGVHLVKVFHLYNGFSRKTSSIGDFVKVSIKNVKPNNFLFKKMKLKSFIIRLKFHKFKKDSSSFFFFENNLILLKKRLSTYGSKVYGPILKNINRRKLQSSFIKIL